MNTKATKMLQTLPVLWALTGCNGESSNTALSGTGMERIDAPFREHGYQGLHHRILGSEENLTALLTEVERQDGWNDKQAFTTALATFDVDFTEANIILFRMTEGSGSIELHPNTPVVSAEGASVEIERKVPTGGTGDMAYYSLLYAIDKDIAHIDFVKGSQPYSFQNKPGGRVYPVNCALWFDGCNHCDIGTDGVAVCDEKYCPTYEDSRCVQWKEDAQAQ